MTYDREEASKEVEKLIKSSKRIKVFVDKNGRANLRLVNNYMKCINLYMKRINDIISQYEYAGRKIKIENIASKNLRLDSKLEKNTYIYSRQYLNLPITKLFSSLEAKIFLKEYATIG